MRCRSMLGRGRVSSASVSPSAVPAQGVPHALVPVRQTTALGLVLYSQQRWVWSWWARLAVVGGAQRRQRGLYQLWEQSGTHNEVTRAGSLESQVTPTQPPGIWPPVQGSLPFQPPNTPGLARKASLSSSEAVKA